MTAIKNTKVARNLKKKGFDEDSSGHHIVLRYKHGGKLVKGMETYISHSREDLGAGRLSKMGKQCKLSNETYPGVFNGVADCSIDKAELIRILKNAGRI